MDHLITSGPQFLVLLYGRSSVGAIRECLKGSVVIVTHGRRNKYVIDIQEAGLNTINGAKLPRK